MLGSFDALGCPEGEELSEGLSDVVGTPLGAPDGTSDAEGITEGSPLGSADGSSDEDGIIEGLPLILGACEIVGLILGLTLPVG